MLSHLGVCVGMVAAMSELRLHFTVPFWSQPRSDRGHFTRDHPGASKWLKREQFQVFFISWYTLCTANALCFLLFSPIQERGTCLSPYSSLKAVLHSTVLIVSLLRQLLNWAKLHYLAC